MTAEEMFIRLGFTEKQGHFKDVNIEKQIGEILLNCEVVKNAES